MSNTATIVADPIEHCPIGKTNVPCCLRAGHRGDCKYKCAEPTCPGLHYPASVIAHPIGCGANHEHPLASKLYRKFKAGSGTLTKDEAWTIANELDRLHAIEREARL